MSVIMQAMSSAQNKLGQEDARYHVVHKQWIRWSEQNGEHIVYSCNRIKEARGMAKTHFVSHMDMMARHEYLTYAWDWELDEDNLWVALADDEGLFYYVGYEVQDGLHFERLFPNKSG